MSSERKLILHKNIVELLDRLTKEGKVLWFRREVDPELVYCQCHRDFMVFELSDGTPENLNPFDGTHGITLTVRGVSVTWLEGLDEEWDCLIALLRQAEVDEGKLPECHLATLESVVLDMSGY